MVHIRGHINKVTVAHQNDIDDITRILNQAIEWGDANAYTETFKAKDRVNWLKEISNGNYAVYVYKDNEQVLGYLSISPYRQGRGAFSNTAEVSYYVEFDHHRKGIATALMKTAIEHCKENEIKHLLAFLYAHNESSIAFLKKFGFVQWGLFPGIAVTEGKVFDHVVFGKKLAGV